MHSLTRAPPWVGVWHSPSQRGTAPHPIVRTPRSTPFVETTQCSTGTWQHSRQTETSRSRECIVLQVRSPQNIRDARESREACQPRCAPVRFTLRGQHGMIKYMDPQICIHACALLYKLLVSSSSSSCSLYKLPESSSCSRSFCAQPSSSRISVESARRVSAARGHLPASLVSIVRIVLPVYESGQVPYHGSCHRHSYCYRGGSCCPALA